MAYNYTGKSWDDFTYKSMDGTYKIKASAARNGATIEGATKALGKPPSTMNVSGYNPNIAKANDFEDAQLATKLGLVNSSGTGSASKPVNAMNTPTAPAAPAAGYKVQSTTGPTLKELEAERDALTATANKYGGDVMRESEPKIARLNDLINKQMQGSSYTGSPASRAAELKTLEGYYESAWNMPSGDGYLARINQLRNDLGMPSRQQEEAARSATDQARLSGLEAMYQATKGNPVAAAQLGEIQQLRQKMGMPAFKEQATNDNQWDQFWDTAGATNTGVRNDILDGLGYQAARVGNAVGGVLDPLIKADPTGLVGGALAVGGGVGTAAGLYPGATSNPGRPMSDPSSVTVDYTNPNQFNPVGDAQRKQQTTTPYPEPGPNGTLTGGGVDRVNVGNPNAGTTTNQQMGQTTGREIYPTPDGLPPTGQTVATTPGTGGNSNPPPTGSSSTPLVDGNAAPGTGGGTIDPTTGLMIGAGVLDTVGSIVTGNAMADAQRDAAAKMEAAANADRALQEKIYNQSRDDMLPWRDAGLGALNGLKTFDKDYGEFSFNNDPNDPNRDKGYAFRLSEGLKELQASAAARGTLRSGNTLQAITKYSQDAASQEYNNAYSRWNTNRGNKLNAMQSLAGVGQSAVGSMNSSGQNYANAAGQAGQNAANAQAGGITGAADARAGGWMGAMNTATNSLNSWLQYNRGNQMNNAMMKMLGGS